MVARSASSVRSVAAPPVELFVDADLETGELVPVGSTDADAAGVRPFGEDPFRFSGDQNVLAASCRRSFWISARFTNVGSAVTAALSSADA
jgi:hypothetical protein